MDDIIYRQDAIDAITNSCGMKPADRIIAIDALTDLPSAQPEIHFDEWCVGCKEYDQTAHCCHRFTKVIRQTVAEIKAEQPERKKGKWINGHWDGDSNFRIDGRGNCWYVRECSNCHEEIEGKPTKYCPNCGCRMKEGEEHEREGRND